MNASMLGWVAALLTGMLFALQPGINAQLAKHFNSPVQAAMVSFSVGTLALLGLCLALPQAWPNAAQWKAIPLWQWTGGFIGAMAVGMSLWLAPRLGAAGLVLALLAGQIMISLVLDHFGWIGFEQKPISVQRIVGVVLTLGGVALVVRS